MTKQTILLKMIEGRIETIQNLAIESIELIYNGGYNEAIDNVLNLSNVDEYAAKQIRELKK